VTRAAIRSISLLIILALPICGLSVEKASGQIVALYNVVYRPPGVNYRVMTRGNHEVIYQEGARNQARETLKALIETMPASQLLLGTSSDFGLTVILNNYSDAGNGYLTPFPFKSEIETVALRGRGLSLRHESWTQLVTTHELVHAVQAEFTKSKSLVGAIRFFSPDFARAINLFIPPGFTEGLAVFRESQVPAGAGRLNHPFFLMQARAGMNAGKGWTLSQMLEQPSYTRPFDRFYKGGALFTQFFIQTYGKAGVARIFNWQQNLPILGFGASLRYATRESPGKVQQRFENWYELRETALEASIGDRSSSRLVVGRKGEISRKPQWISDSTWVVFSLGYNLSRGFRKVSTNGKKTSISRNEITDDAFFHLEQHRPSILYSRYDEHPYTRAVKTSHSYSLDISSGTEHRILGSDHTYNPVRLNGGAVVALQSVGQFNRIVEIGASTIRGEKLAYARSNFASLMPRPGSDSLAVIVNVEGHQAVFLIDSSTDDWKMNPWIGFPNSSIYDGSWSASGRYFSFTSDRTGILNVYVLDAHTEQISQVTNVLYTAMEGQVSPSGDQIVYIEYEDQRFDLKVAPFPGPFHVSINRDEANYTWTTDWEEKINRSSDDSPVSQDVANQGLVGQDKTYHAWHRLSPRMIYPTAYLDKARDNELDARLGFGIGVALQGTDPLQRIAYHAEGVLQKNRIWGEVGIQTGLFAFRPGLKLERRPSTVIDGNTGQRFIRERTSLEASILLPFTIEQNVDRTSFISSIALSRRSERFLDDDLNVIRGTSSQLTLLPAFFFGRRVLRNPRDIIPSSGQTLSWFGDFELTNDLGDTRQGWVLLGNVYLPLLQCFNTGIRLNAGLLHQNNASIFGLDFFKPIGWSNSFLNDDTFLRYGLRVVQPVVYPDNGWVTIPAFLRAIYVFGIAEYLHRANDTPDNISSVGAGLGVKFRLFHHFDFDFSMTYAYRVDDKQWKFISDVREE